MEVQFFKQPELRTINERPEDVLRHKELCEKLGIPVPKMDMKSEIINIYQPLNSYEVNCLEVLCKESCDISKYDIAPIPLEILEEVAILKENNVFEDYRILHSVDDPDPILLGRRYRNDEDRKKGYSWQKQNFLIARWGAEAKPLSQLIKDAQDRARVTVRKQLKEALVSLLAWKGREDDLADKLIQSGSSESFYIRAK